MDKFEITGPGEYLARGGRKIIVETVEPEAYRPWPVIGRHEGESASALWRRDGSFAVSKGAESASDIVGVWEEPSATTPVDDDAVDAEFVVEAAPDSGVIGVDFEPVDYRPESSVIAENAAANALDISATSLAPPGPTICEVMRREPFTIPELRDAGEPEPCDYRESAETLAAALRNLLASLPDVVSVKTGDAATLARLALDGFAP